MNKKREINSSFYNYICAEQQQKVNRAGIKQEDIQPGSNIITIFKMFYLFLLFHSFMVCYMFTDMKVWTDPFERKKSDTS